MRLSARRGAILGGLLAAQLATMTAAPALAGDAPTGPIDTLAGIGPALAACWNPPAESSGLTVTVRLSLNRAGGIIGQPRLAYAGPGRDAAHYTPRDRAFVAAVASALKACTPLPLSPGLGGAVAGRVFTIRFTGPARRS